MPISIFSLDDFVWHPKRKHLVLRKTTMPHKEVPANFWVYGKYLHVRFERYSTSYDIQNTLYRPSGSYGAESGDLPYDEEIKLDKIRAVIYWEKL
jgi:hypothetical protein